MLLKSKRRTAPRSLAARAFFARVARYARRRSVLTRSSQSTVCAPGEANGRVIADTPVAAEAWPRPVVGSGRIGLRGVQSCYTSTERGNPSADERARSTMAADGRLPA